MSISNSASSGSNSWVLTACRLLVISSVSDVPAVSIIRVKATVIAVKTISLTLKHVTSGISSLSQRFLHSMTHLVGFSFCPI